MRRREFITLLGGAAPAWSVGGRAQQPALPVIAFINGGAADAAARYKAAFLKGLSEAGHVDGQNVVVEYHWLEGRYDRLPALASCGFDPTRRCGDRDARQHCRSTSG